MQALEVAVAGNDLTPGEESCDGEKILEGSVIETVHKLHYHNFKT